MTLEDSNDKVLPLNEENDLLLNTDTTTLKQDDMLQTSTSKDVHSTSRLEWSRLLRLQ